VLFSFHVRGHGHGHSVIYSDNQQKSEDLYDEAKAKQQQLCSGKHWILCGLRAAACFLAAGHSLAASFTGECTGNQATAFGAWHCIF
jgi:hypothetical protein